MFSVHRTLSLRYLQRHSLRALLIVASIALGVGTLVATRALNETMTKATVASTNPMAGVVDLIVSNGEQPVSTTLTSGILKVKGVKSVDSRIFKSVYLKELDKNVLMLGLDLKKIIENIEKNPGKSADITTSTGAAGAFWAASWFVTPVLVGKALSDDLGGTINLHVRKDQRGAKITALPVMDASTLILFGNPQGHGPFVAASTLSAARPLHTLTKVGYLEARNEFAALGGYALIVDLPVAGRILGLNKDQVHCLDIALEPGANRDLVRAEIKKRVGGANVRTPEEQNQSLQSVMSGMQICFSLYGVAALVVGVFLVYNCLAATVAERRHEIGILLSVGATRAQVCGLFAGEAGLLGLAGSLLGIPLGFGLAKLGLAPMQNLLRDIFTSLSAHEVEISTSLMIFAVVTGVLTSICAALIPASRAARENPADAVRRAPRATTTHHLLLQASISASMIGVGTVLILLRGSIPYKFGTFGGLMIVLVGALVASPFFAAVVARLFQLLARRFLSIEWRLAADNIVRSPGRTGLVIGALAAGVSLVAQTSGTIRSNRMALRDWVDHAFGADLFITADGPVSAGQVQLMEESLGDDLRKLPEVEAVLPSRKIKTAWKDTQVVVLAINASQEYVMEGKRLGQTATHDLMKMLSEQPDTVVMSENFAALYGVRTGDTITLQGDHENVKLRVIGQLVDYNWSHGSLIVNRDDFKKYWRDDKVNAFDVYLKNGVDPHAAKEMINNKFGHHLLFAMTRNELHQHIAGMIERLYGIAYGQVIIEMLVAALGVVTALLISVLQRRRELGLLRAIGASRGQVIYSVLAEACLMGVIGTAIGLVVSIPLQWYVLRIVILEESGFLFPVSIPWLGGLIIAVSAMAVATLAGLWPALHSVRMRIPEAIAYE